MSRADTAQRSLEHWSEAGAFDARLSLAEMEAAPVLRDYLAGCRQDDGSYRFSHEVSLLWL